MGKVIEFKEEKKKKSKINRILILFFKQVSSINRVLRNLASKSFDSISSSSSSTGGGGGGIGGGGGGGGASQDGSTYDKLRLLNNNHPWPSHTPAWYNMVPQVTGCLTSSHSLMNGQMTPNGTSYNNDLQNSNDINKLNMSNGECKKGNYYYVIFNLLIRN